ncbi:periplasmic heavy metal sensor [Nitratireductor sp. CAU 1489]|uniref:Periplasmic heavy metal sensor n=1 Tax=Nitratireductor arenosus TaxID=2682096 RepID=A0A844QE97_9HYPH|nr:Spy/CpxP family protein refolding chaperone [Nitratireductor arenosus]MVA96413.1 periplasmic heavy metal sensor [Nitratireductor arenosus]
MQDDNHHFDDSINGGTPRSGGWMRGAIVGGLALAAIAGTGLVATAGGGFGASDGHMGGQVLKARMGGFIMERRMGHMLDEIGATDEQQDKLWEIIDAARAELRPMIREFRDTRKDIVNIISAPTIDREAAEKLRGERVQAMDEASRKMTAAMLDAAEVLTPEQRAKLAEHIEKRGKHHRR